MKYLILGKLNIDIFPHIQSEKGLRSVLPAALINGEFQKLAVIKDCRRLPVKFSFPIPVGYHFSMAGKDS